MVVALDPVSDFEVAAGWVFAFDLALAAALGAVAGLEFVAGAPRAIGVQQKLPDEEHETMVVTKTISLRIVNTSKTPIVVILLFLDRSFHRGLSYIFYGNYR
jgi:hypothetical protein